MSPPQLLHGDDVLVGGLGDDVMTGGLGNDIFDFNVFEKDAVDTIAGFIEGEDVLDLRDIVDLTGDQSITDWLTVDYDTDSNLSALGTD